MNAPTFARGTTLGPDLIRREFNDAMRALMAFVKRAFLANSTIGIIGLIDDATTSCINQTSTGLHLIKRGSIK